MHDLQEHHIKTILEWLGSHSGLATKHDLKELEHKLMSQLNELAGQLAALNALAQTILTEVQAVVAGGTGGNPALPADAQNNLATLTSTINAIQGALVPDTVTINGFGNITGTVGTPLTVPLSGIGSSVKGATVTVTATSSDPTIVPTPVVTLDVPPITGSVTFTPAAAGVATITIAVTDGTASATTAFTVTVS